MPAEIDYLPIAVGAGSNVDSQGNFVGSGYQSTGFVAGIAKSSQVNKCLRQSSMMTAAWAQFISTQLGGIDVIDDGNLTALQGFLTSSLAAMMSAVTFSQPANAFATVYQAGAKPRTVSVVGSISLGVAHAASLRAFIGPTNVPAISVAWQSVTNSSGLCGVTFRVPPGWFYKVTTNNGFAGETDPATLNSWSEWDG